MLVNQEFIIEKVQSGEGIYAVVKNPSYVFPPVEYYPLAPAKMEVEEIKAVFMDMDGTTTTTEVLCIHSLEQMIRRMSGHFKFEQWKGLDPNADFPHIIGNSTTRHVEYLIHKYGNLLGDVDIEKAFLEAAWWTLKWGNDSNRRLEVIQNLKKSGLAKALEILIQAEKPDEIIKAFSGQINTKGFANRVNLGIDIYYEVYHRILSRLKNGEGQLLRKEILGDSDEQTQLISPMPGIPVLIPLLKGWLGEEAGVFAESLMIDLKTKSESNHLRFNVFETEQKLKNLGKKFEQKPAKLGLVTSSIRYEADIVIQEVFGVMREHISRSLLSDFRKGFIIERLEDPGRVYDAFVTASDSSEIRLKPHRDLYSIALHQAGMLPEDFDKVLGFEDSQSGTIAIRAAGIGCCIAVPFAQTADHDLEAAAHTLPGGVPQAMIEHSLFLSDGAI